MRQRYSFQGEKVSGSLYLVATPIGNLQDITFRAVDTLRQAAVIAAEDTRQTRKLLTHFEIEGPRLISYHEHNKLRMEEEILGLLERGLNVALVSDAGTPGISDPGEEIVKAAVEKGFPVIPIPGASAAIAALIASGLPTGQFSFVGFLPRDRKDRKRELERWKSRKETLIFYEAPHRLRDTIQDMRDVLGDRKLTVARELTKRYEEFLHGTVSAFMQLMETDSPRGEFVLIVEGASDQEAELFSERPWWDELTPVEHVAALVRQGISKKDAIKQAAKERNQPKRKIYQAVLDAEPMDPGAVGEE